MIGLPGAVSVKIPQPKLRVDFKYFFDRKIVTDTIGREKVKSLKRAGYKTMQIARRSITKQGMAKPQLKVAKEYANLSLAQIATLPGVAVFRGGVQRDSRGRFTRRSPAMRGVEGRITEATRRKVMERLREVQNPSHSDPGQPPFTHTGMFRNHIVFSYDPGSESVVVGQAMPRGEWLANLHEFGGVQPTKAWAFVPKYQPYRAPILAFMKAGRSPRNASRWRPTSITDIRRYPARPYMRPAVLKAAASGAIVKSFSVGG